jgi:hypothetical protein
MFRLVKLAVVGLIAYAAYEFVVGMTEARPIPAPVRARRGGGARLSGSKRRGRKVVTEDSDGGSTTETVGRGVV